MDISSLLTVRHPLLLKMLEKEHKLILSGVGNPTAKTFLAGTFLKNSKLQVESSEVEKMCWICQDMEEILEIQKDLNIWFAAPLFRMREGITEKELIHTIVQFAQTPNAIFLTEFAQLQAKIPSLPALEKIKRTFKKGDKQESIDFLRALSELLYEHSDETVLPIGTYRKIGESLEIHPVGSDHIVKIDWEFDSIESISAYDPLIKKRGSELESLTLYPTRYSEQTKSLLHLFPENTLIIADELYDEDIFEQYHKDFADKKLLIFTSFPSDQDTYYHLRYLSILRFYLLADFLADIREKIQTGWDIWIYTKRAEELSALLTEEKLRHTCDLELDLPLKILQMPEDASIPSSFQNPEEKIAFITDKEIFTLKKASRNQSVSKMNIDFITSLTINDYVVHFDHGIGVFDGIVQKTFDGITREYLEIHFAENDKMFIPVDQSDKVSKYIVEDTDHVTLSKLGGGEWQKQLKKVKKDTEALAKELLELYAKRAQVRRDGFIKTDREQVFAETFPYTETPGQLAAIMDVTRDMQSQKPMDRLVCGDVGFGKTEVAMRAAFKAVESGKQVALISPVTILAEQHYESFMKRMDSFGIRIAMLSRFKTPAEQTKILEELRKGDIDIIIATHRLLQEDIQFFNLGLLIIDEEQRFGVKQKEKLKKLRSQVDVLTLTATPIPRTLNLSLNKLRDITTITTPPPGRRPIITEVRKYSDQLIRDAILKEIERKGQIYFLHNRVETIESMAEKLRLLVPEATFVVAHGQMESKQLEERILEFKRGNYDVLISSTIIENGIDLANANTMIINNAEKFGLSQLYQLRGRIGRSNKQAYAYLLYHAQKLNMDAKKRLRALVEASELGSGFQIALRDLEIRGAGDILGSSQHGSMHSIGVSHFLKLLQKTIKEMQDGTYLGEGEPQVSDVNIDIPINAYIPDEYITDKKEKIATYQKLASVETIELLEEFIQDIHDEYGKIPPEVHNLFQVLYLKIYARRVGIVRIALKSQGYTSKEVHLILGPICTPDKIIKALEKNGLWKIIGNTLRISQEDLGKNWMEELIETIKKMGESGDK